MTLWKWSRTAATNATADSTCPFPEGMNPGALNDGTRGMMAAAAKYRDDISGAIVTGGTSTAYTVASYQGYDTLAHLDGAMIAFTPHASNGATVTLNVDGLGAKPVRSSPNMDLIEGTIILGTPYVVTYNNTDGVFYLQGGVSNPYGVPVGGTIGWTGFIAPNSAFAMPYGQTLSRTTFPALWTFAQIQITAGNTLYNNGNGTTTFGIYDGRGRVDVCADNMGGSAASVFPSLYIGTTGGVSGASQNIAQNQLPNVSPAFTGINDPVSVTTTGGVWAGTAAGLAPGGGGIPLPAGQAGMGSTGFFTPRGTIASINGGVTQTALNVAQPYIGINKILRVI